MKKKLGKRRCAPLLEHGTYQQTNQKSGGLNG
jgi:hypothetical protein